MMDMLFLVTYRSVLERDGETEEIEEVAEVRAYSEEQARFLAPCAPSDIICVECAVAKRNKAVASAG